MISPTFEQFEEKARLGNVIPVYKEILADLNTPVSAYLKVCGDDYSFLLESVTGGDKWGRYSFIGFDPRCTVRSKHGSVEKIEAGKSETLSSSLLNPLIEVKKIQKNFIPVPDPNLPGFFGGLVGSMSYDVVRFFEEIPDETENDIDAPDFEFMLTDNLLIFDNVSLTIKIVCNVHTDDGDLRSVYEKAVSKIESVEDKLKKEFPLPKKGNGTGLTNNDIKSNYDKEAFKNSVLKIKDYIREGDVIQAVLAQRLSFPVTVSSFNIYRQLRIINPSPYMYYLNFGERQIIGSSPEILVRLEGSKVEVRPIAGTRKRGKNKEEDIELENELLADPKERAEHLMLLDLGRNDLGRIAETGSVNVSEEFIVERYSHVMHIVSNVEAQIDRKRDVDWVNVLAATFPAGTVSGAPKIRAMEIIDELEPNRRGVYAGSIGYISYSGNMDTAIAIRTLVVTKGRGYLGVGAGIVADSDPEKEFEETMNKGMAVLKAVDEAEKGWDE